MPLRQGTSAARRAAFRQLRLQVQLGQIQLALELADGFDLGVALLVALHEQAELVLYHGQIGAQRLLVLALLGARPGGAGQRRVVGAGLQQVDLLREA